MAWSVPVDSELNLRRLILLAAILAAFAIIDEWLLLGEYARRWPFAVTVDVYLLIVVQVGLGAWMLGRWVSHPFLCWGAYLWLLILLNFVVLATASRPHSLYLYIHTPYIDPPRDLAFAVFSAQVGLLAFWAALGPAPWQHRLSAALVAVAWFALVCLPFSGHDEGWGVLRNSFRGFAMLVQAPTVVIACALGAGSGFGSIAPENRSRPRQPSPALASSSALATCLPGPLPPCRYWWWPGTSTGATLPGPRGGVKSLGPSDSDSRGFR